MRPHYFLRPFFSFAGLNARQNPVISARKFVPACSPTTYNEVGLYPIRSGWQNSHPESRMHRTVTWLGCAVATFWLGLISARATELSSFQAGDGGWQLGTLAVGNLDNSGQLSIVVPYRNSSGQMLLDAFKPNGTRPAPFFPTTAKAKSMSPPRSTISMAMAAMKLFSPAAQTSSHYAAMVRSFGPVKSIASITSRDSGFMTVTNGFYCRTAAHSFRTCRPTPFFPPKFPAR